MSLACTDTLAHFKNFLLAYVHTVLFLRSIYPASTFVTSRFRNTFVHQSRSTVVCGWIIDAITAVHDKLVTGNVARIGIVIYQYTSEEAEDSVSAKVMERYMLDVSAFPVVERREREKEADWEERHPLSPISLLSVDTEESSAPTPFEPRKTKPDPLDKDTSPDLSEQFRAILIQLTARCSELPCLPIPCFFNVCMELKDDGEADPLIRHPGPWVSAKPAEGATGKEGTRINEGSEHGKVSVVPIRTVIDRWLNFEAWVEVYEAKEASDVASPTSID